MAAVDYWMITVSMKLLLPLLPSPPSPPPPQQTCAFFGVLVNSGMDELNISRFYSLSSSALIESFVPSLPFFLSSWSLDDRFVSVLKDSVVSSSLLLSSLSRGVYLGWKEKSIRVCGRW